MRPAPRWRSPNTSLAELERAAATAARLSPPDHIKRELGERPSDPTKAAVWDRAVRGIEGYRVRNGVVDRDSALGPKPKDRAAQAEQRRGQGAAAARTARVETEAPAHRRAVDGSRDRPMTQQAEDRRNVGSLTEPLLNADEAAQLLHVPRSTLYELVRSRHLPHIRVGRGLRFTRRDLASWIADNTFR